MAKCPFCGQWVTDSVLIYRQLLHELLRERGAMARGEIALHFHWGGSKTKYIVNDYIESGWGHEHIDRSKGGRPRHMVIPTDI